MKVLMFSTAFPKGHPRYMEATGFPALVAAGEKLHTVRANKNGYFKAGESVSCRVWCGRPYASTQAVFTTKRLESIERVEITHRQVGGVVVKVEGVYVNATRFARNDGLTLQDFIAWFFPDGKPGTWTGDVLHFTDLRYGGAES